jgi:4-hydroxymandelate oxidase
MASVFSRREVLERTVGGFATLAAAGVGRYQDRESLIPPGVVTLEDFEALARQRVDAKTFEILRGGAADELTIRSNRDAFNRIRLRPRVLVDVSNVVTSLTLFGQTLSSPIALAPAGVHGLLHPEGELETARGAAIANTVLVIPSSHGRPIEEIVKVTSQPPWYQVYVERDRGATREQAQRAEEAGCKVLVVTVDGAAPAVRNGMMRPPFPPLATPGQFRTISDPSLTWKDVAWLRSIVGIPVVLKGILDPDDAERAVTEGADGIVVSNHGGRTLDSVPATIDALPVISERVSGRMPVLMDGGVRRGTPSAQTVSQRRHGGDDRPSDTLKP